MDIDANINIEIEDSDIVDAVREELAAAISSYDESNPLHDRIDWDSAHRAGLMTFEHTDDEVRSLIREVIELNADVLRPIITAQVDQAILRTVRDTVRYEVRPIIQDTVRNEITKWVHALGSVFSNMTHNHKTREDTSE